MENHQRSRRQFLGWLTALTVGALLFGRYLRPRRTLPKPLLALAKSDLPPHGALVFREERIAVMLDGQTVYALSLVCTHLGCSVAVTPTELRCPCHGSIFDRAGNVIKGPANRPLHRLAVVERDGMLIITA